MGIRQPLLLVVLLLVSALLSSSSAAYNFAATGVTFPLSPDCPTNCSDKTFEYPFGVGHGCFKPGFELTCDNATDPPKLLLGNSSSTIELVDGVHVKEPDFDVSASAVVVMDAHNNFSQTSWTAPANAPYVVSKGNNLVVIGCSAVGYLVDLATNQNVANCSTTCPSGGARMRNDSVDSDSCNGVEGCCTGPLSRSVQSYAIRLHRKEDKVSSVSSSVKAFIAATEAFFDHPRVVMNWRIVNQTCEEARKETGSYACLGGGHCSNTEDDHFYPGYHCNCQSYDEGNPYVPFGCDDPSITVSPSNNCTRKCGNVTIPFPFGLEKGCYRDYTFALTCNGSSSPPVLHLDFKYAFQDRISNIILDEATIEFSPSGVQLDDDREGSTSDPSPDINENFYQPPASDSFGLLRGRDVYRWAIFENRSCAASKAESLKFACGTNNSQCVDVNMANEGSIYGGDDSFSGYLCKCKDGFEGNPYLPLGCTDINECNNSQKYVCYGDCINTLGSYICNCPPKTHGDPTKAPCIAHNKLSGLLLGVIIGVSIGFGTLLISMTSIFASWKWKKIIQKRIRERHFNENHGILLQQLIASNEDTINNVKIFSLEDLEKATNNFDISRIIGQGGHGTVYKGILSDQRVVAIKRSKIKEKSEIDEFLNEVTILSQINHRNVVKLFGCCLETEVPLLVYEFISNGTLFHHLHSPEHKTTLSWIDRLRIAAEAAWALEYLHSSASISIFHRDMKSLNILLDDYFTAKVSDFGAARLIPLDQSHIFTAIQGTFGYLDPEYYQTSQLTEKSDVYSFGIILLELLTGEMPISLDRNEEERNLIMEFLRALREDKHFELMKTRVLIEGTREELDKVARLAETCLKIKGSERPTMTEVEVQLRRLHKAKL